MHGGEALSPARLPRGEPLKSGKFGIRITTEYVWPY